MSMRETDKAQGFKIYQNLFMFNRGWGKNIVALMPVDFPADFSRPKGKKNLEELVSYQ